MALDSATLSKAFDDAGLDVSSDDISELLYIGKEHGLNATALAENWEAFLMTIKSKKSAQKTLAANVEQFKSYVKKNTKVETAYGGYGDGYRFTNTLELAEDDGSPPVFTRTPAPATTRQSAGFRAELQTPAGGTPFSRRPAKLVSNAALNGHLEALAPVADKMEVDAEFIELLVPGVPRGVRYMSEKLEGKVDYIEGRIGTFVETLVDDYGLSATSPVHSAAPDVVVSAGRVICDSDGKLNEASLLLEGNLQHSSGARVRLEMREIPCFSTFPGQVVAVEGVNPSGFTLVAKNVVCSLPPPLAPPAPEAVAAAPVSLVVAAGPFTCSDDLIFEPLEEVFAYCRTHRPDALILLGPFVDAEHPTIASGLIDCTFAELFDLQLRQRLDQFCEEIGASCRVVLVPSVRDAHHDAVYPQPPLSDGKFECPAGQVVFAPNPCLLRVGGLTVGATSVDVLKHLSAAETSRENDKRTDRMSRLAAHLVGQRSFYPLTPPAPGTCLDSSLASEGLKMTFRPDVLLLPSDLASFAKAVHTDLITPGAAPGYQTQGTAKPALQPAFVCVNPGRAAKGSSGGSFAHVQVRAAEEGLSTPLAERTRVDLVKV